MSKTVKRVSETVKRVMRVMMVGLIAMLGAKAEAHYYVIGGIPKRCSHCVDGEFGKDHKEHDAVAHTDVAEFRLSTKKVDYLCPPTGSIQQSTIANAMVKKDLVVLKQIVEGDAAYRDKGGVYITGDATYTEITFENGSFVPVEPAMFNVVVKFSDSPLKDKAVCPGSVLPVDVLIRETDLSIVSYWCDAGDPEKKCVVFDKYFSPSCTLANKWNLANPPAEGIAYVCRP